MPAATLLKLPRLADPHQAEEFLNLIGTYVNIAESADTLFFEHDKPIRSVTERRPGQQFGRRYYSLQVDGYIDPSGFIYWQGSFTTLELLAPGRIELIFNNNPAGGKRYIYRKLGQPVHW